MNQPRLAVLLPARGAGNRALRRALRDGVIGGASCPQDRSAGGAEASGATGGQWRSSETYDARAAAPNGAALGNTTKNQSSVELQRLRTLEKRRGRWELQETTREISRLGRVCACRRRRIGSAEPSLRVKDGVAHFAGVQLCGSVWACPNCGAHIRQERAEEINRALVRLLTEPIHWGEGSPRSLCCPIGAKHDATTGTVMLLTLTMRHEWGEALKDLIAMVADGFAAITSGRGWQEDREAFGLTGYIRAHDATHGVNGWHPHLHVILTAKRELTDGELVKLRRRLYVRWARAIVGRRPKVGSRSEASDAVRRPPSLAHGIDLEKARSVDDVARYASEIAGDVDQSLPLKKSNVVVRARTKLGMELARADLKKGTETQRTPWEILRAVHDARPVDSDGVVDDCIAAQRKADVSLWREYERETKGKQAMRWSTGLKAILGVYDRSDDEIVNAVIGGEVVHSFNSIEWWAVTQTKGAQATVLHRAEDGGSVAVAEYLSAIVPAWQERRAREREFEKRHPELFNRARDGLRRVA